MDNLIDFGDDDDQAPAQQNDNFNLGDGGDWNVLGTDKKSSGKKKQRNEEPADDGVDLINFNERPSPNENLLDFDDGEDTIQLDHDSDDEAKEDEFGPIEQGQKRIIVKYNDLKFPVNWWQDTPLSEVREMVICACDSIIDSGFELLSPSDGQPINLKKVENIKGRGEVYTIVKADEKEEYEKLLGDRWRKIVLEVEPLRHIEAQKAIEFMQIGSNLMRHTGKDFPAMRLFQISSDFKRLIWFSSSKKISDSKIDLRNATNIVIGQKNKLFESYPMPQLSHLSFALEYKDKSKEGSIALTCKDELEYDLWVTGLRALLYHFKNYNISKMMLLGHSRAFNEELRKKNIGESNKFIVEQDKSRYDSKSLHDMFKRPMMNEQQIRDKMVVYGKRIRSQKDRVEEIAEDLSHNQAGEGAVGMGYVTLAQNEDKADDQTLQISRMYELIEGCEQRHKQIQEIIDKEGIPKDSNEQYKHIDFEIWSLELDLENVGDICKRLTQDNKQTFRERLKSLLPSIF